MAWAWDTPPPCFQLLIPGPLWPKALPCDFCLDAHRSTVLPWMSALPGGGALLPPFSAVAASQAAGRLPSQARVAGSELPAASWLRMECRGCPAPWWLFVRPGR